MQLRCAPGMKSSWSKIWPAASRRSGRRLGSWWSCTMLSRTRTERWKTPECWKEILFEVSKVCKLNWWNARCSSGRSDVMQRFVFWQDSPATRITSSIWRHSDRTSASSERNSDGFVINSLLWDVIIFTK